MFVFIIWLSGEIPANYQACIDSVAAIYPQLVIIRDWGDCPYARPADPRRASEVLRRWVMSQHEEALYLDADVHLFSLLSFDKTDKPWFGRDEKGVDEWLIYHNGQRGFFSEYVKQPMLTSYNHYEIEPNEKFIHHGFTMNRERNANANT
jgi:hypothetical protein